MGAEIRPLGPSFNAVEKCSKPFARIGGKNGEIVLLHPVKPSSIIR